MVQLDLWNCRQKIFEHRIFPHCFPVFPVKVLIDLLSFPWSSFEEPSQQTGKNTAGFAVQNSKQSKQITSCFQIQSHRIAFYIQSPLLWSKVQWRSRKWNGSPSRFLVFSTCLRPSKLMSLIEHTWYYLEPGPKNHPTEPAGCASEIHQGMLLVRTAQQNGQPASFERHWDHFFFLEASIISRTYIHNVLEARHSIIVPSKHESWTKTTENTSQN